MSDALTPDELLLGYAAGNLPGPLALAVATHLALSPERRAMHRQLEELGGVLLEGIEPQPCSPALWGKIAAALDEADVEPPPAPPPGHPEMPAPLRRHLKGSLDSQPWQGTDAWSYVEFAPAEDGWQASLVRVKAGLQAPAHEHLGLEVIVVLAGTFVDSDGRHSRGDLYVSDDATTHRPRADATGDCVCLCVLGAPIRMVEEG